ncbi:MAG: hypothetical protein QM572_00615, partial [Nocardioides sp.]|uniref:hypothetical protein n=1 Tax=Nocardioides sp. TaxID=35761 RepID=UPI0039E392F5
RLGRVLAGPTGTAVAAALVAAFAACPLFGAVEVDGELLALPFVIGGLGLVLTGRSARAWAAAGVLAVGAVSIKQNLADVAIAGGVVLVVRALTRRPWWPDALAFAGGAVAALALLLAWAAWHGTSATGLWHAVVTFRTHAGPMIREAAPEESVRHAWYLGYAFLGSGALAVVLAALVPSRRAPDSRRALTDLWAPTAAVLGWETLGVIVGGSYWLHYLIGMIPGLLLAALAVALRRPRRVGWLAAGILTCVAVGATTWPLAGYARVYDRKVVAWLDANARPGDTAVVAWGHAAILHDTGLRSPYPHLWSLPVRVRDPHLARFTRLLSGPSAPRWIIADHGRLTSWGIDGAGAERVLAARYDLIGAFGGWTVYERRTFVGG